jgi:hypothetical protein
MTSEGDPTKGKLIRGAIPDLPIVPDLNPMRALEWVEERSESIMHALENERILNISMRELLAPFEARIFAAAGSRLLNSEYEPKKKRKKEKTSKWRDDWQNGFAQYTLEFRTKRRDREVDGVDSFRMDKNGSSVAIELKEGQVAEVSFKYDTSVHQFWKETPSLDWSTPWAKWISDVVIDRGIQRKVWEKRSSGNGPRVMDKVTFDTTAGSLRYSTVYDPNKRSAVYFGRRPPPEPLVEIGDEYRFNAGRNRFNHLYDKTSRTREEIENDYADISDPAVRDSLVQYALQHSLPKYALLTPEEFTTGLILLLDTIPLE